LVDVLSSGWSTVPNDIVTIMIRFRKSLCFSWLSRIGRLDRVRGFASATRTVLLFMGHSDTTVRVTAYSTLGGFLVAVAPISPITFYKAFSQVIDHTEERTMSAKLSIAVINMFTYLSRFISSVRISSYIE
jgi:hypothetical protein